MESRRRRLFNIIRVWWRWCYVGCCKCIKCSPKYFWFGVYCVVDHVWCRQGYFFVNDDHAGWCRFYCIWFINVDFCVGGVSRWAYLGCNEVWYCWYSVGTICCKIWTFFILSACFWEILSVYYTCVRCWLACYWLCVWWRYAIWFKIYVQGVFTWLGCFSYSASVVLV